MTASSSLERLFVSTTPGLEPALERELRRMKLRVHRVPSGGGVEVEGPAGSFVRVNLESRVASRVLMRVGSFPAADPRALQQGLQRVELAGFLKAPGEAVSLSVSSHRSRLGAGQVKDVAARVWRVAPERTSDEDSPEGSRGPLQVQLRLDGDQCTVSVDTSGELLYRRGYRQEVSRAPLRETLAAGVLELADYRGDEPLWDPMCGSGTFVIEAAWIALGRAPGLQREQLAFEVEGLEALKAELRQRERPKPPHELRATDLNAGSLGVARRNARRAGVQPFLVLERDDVTSPKHLPTSAHGLLVTNPPYGKRVGEGGDLPSLYAALGRLLRERLPGWRGAVLVPALRRGAPDVQLERALGLEPEDVFELDNGGLPLRLLLFAASRQMR